jgi:hypothetical protein
MNDDLTKYKKNQIDKLNQQFNVQFARLTNVFTINIRNIQKSRLSLFQKRNTIKQLNQRFNLDKTNLQNNLNIAIQKINAFIPEFNVDKSKIKNKKALLIGINYLNTPYQLNGCIDDTKRMHDLLSTLGFQNIKILTDVTAIKPTKTVILNELTQLIKTAASGDVLFVYYSGHGSNTYDTSGDETDKTDEMLVSLDLKAVLDDELKNILNANMKTGVTLIGLFDSCHSGTVLDLKYQYSYNGTFTENDKVTECNGNVLMISGCKDEQTSVEAYVDNKLQGALSWCFIDSINKNPNSSWRELLKTISEKLEENGFTQKPQLSTDSFYDINSPVFI